MRSPPHLGFPAMGQEGVQDRATGTILLADPGFAGP
jgi:hypothetical protein